MSLRAKGVAMGALPQTLTSVLQRSKGAIVSRPVAAFVLAYAAGVGSGLACAASVADRWERYHTVEDVPARRFKRREALDAVVVKVSDGDTLRARHVPALDFLRSKEGRTRAEGGGGTARLSEETLLIRLCAVDAPETAKFGGKGMPFADEATDFVKGQLQGKTVRVKLLSRDQYGRAVADVSYGGVFGLFRKDLSVELLKEGLATVYKSAGAQYDTRSLDEWERIEDDARMNKKGIWSAGDAMDPAAYKRQQKRST